jgi:5-(carboxyamino)imidazole ribonucleotide synthase
LKRVGIIGGGQLGQMLGHAANRLGIECLFLDPGDAPPASAAGRVIRAAYDDRVALSELAAASDVISYEFENVPVAAVKEIDGSCAVLPPPTALEKAQDRLAEKRLFETLAIPVPRYRAVDSVQDLEAAAEQIGLPLVIKTRRFGYDGKGQAVMREGTEAASIVAGLGSGLIAEECVPFDHEVSAIGVRDISGATVSYPLSRNEHRDGILRVSRAPVDCGALTDIARGYLESLMSELQYVGTLALELFVVNGHLLANEFAPRVHNSGHWSIEGAVTSQFENHIRAITGMPLGSTGLQGFPGMVNIIGTMPAMRDVIDAESAVLHNYGKAARPGRKLGHITVVGTTADDRDARLARISRLLPANSPGNYKKLSTRP